MQSIFNVTNNNINFVIIFIIYDINIVIYKVKKIKQILIKNLAFVVIYLILKYKLLIYT